MRLWSKVALRYMRLFPKSRRRSSLRWLTLFLLLCTALLFIIDRYAIQHGLNLSPALARVEYLFMVSKYAAVTLTGLAAVLVELTIVCTTFTTVVIFGLGIGTGSIILARSLQTALLEGHLRSAAHFQPNVSVTSADSFFIENPAPVLRLLKELPGVVSVSRELSVDMLVASEPGPFQQSESTKVRGVYVEELLRSKEVSLMTTQGRWADLLPAHRPLTESPVRKGIVLGAELAAKIHVSVGSIVRLVYPFGFVGPMGVVPSIKEYEVVALFRTGDYVVDRYGSVILLSNAQQMMDERDQISELSIQVQDPKMSAAVALLVSSVLRKTFPEQSFIIEDWSHREELTIASINQADLAIQVILSLIILVTAMFILSNGMTLVTEKTSEIAMLKTMGLSDQGVMGLFICYGGIMALLGVALGWILSWIACQLLSVYGLPLPNIFYTMEYKFLFSVQTAFSVGISSIGMVLFAIVYPAYRASRLQLLDGLRL